jgi:hypothetical protein
MSRRPKKELRGKQLSAIVVRRLHKYDKLNFSEVLAMLLRHRFFECIKDTLKRRDDALLVPYPLLRDIAPRAIPGSSAHA